MYVYFYRSGVNHKCWLSFFLLFGAVAMVLAGIALESDEPGSETLSNAVFLFAVPVWLCSVVIGVRALKECVRHPTRFPRGRTVAIIILVLAVATASAFTPMYLDRFKSNHSAPTPRTQATLGTTAIISHQWR